MKSIKVLKVNYGKDMSEIFLKLIKDKQHLRNSLIILNEKLRDTEFKNYAFSFMPMRNLMSELNKGVEVEKLKYKDFYNKIVELGLKELLEVSLKFYSKYSNKIFVDIVKTLNTNLKTAVTNYKKTGIISDFKTKKLSKVKSGSVDINSNIVKYDNKTIEFQIFTKSYKKDKSLSNLDFHINIEKILDGLVVKVKNVIVVLKPNRDVYLYITYEEDHDYKEIKRPYSMGIDPGICNHLTIASNNPLSRPIIIKSRSINRIVSNTRYSVNRLNRDISNLMNVRNYGKTYRELTNIRTHITSEMRSITYNEITKINSRIIDYCKKFKIGTIYFGRNIGMKEGNKAKGKKFNKMLMPFPHYTLLTNLKYKCSINGIKLVEQEESYTSKFSSINPENEVWKYDYRSNKPTDAVLKQQGVRGKRGLYKDKSTGVKMNADVNGAYNIMLKGMKETYNPSKIKVTRPLKMKDDFQFLEYLALA